MLCAWGAARAGAGYVTVAAPKGAAAALRAHLIEQVVVTYDEARPGRRVRTILDLTNRCSAIAIGPGLGLSDAFGEIVNGVIGGSDAARRRRRERALSPRQAAAARTATGRWCSRRTPASSRGSAARAPIAPGERLARLRAFVDEHGITTLLKGRTTLIADRDARHLNPTGTNALATAGTGDVLTGAIATLLAQGLAPVDAARAGAYWHGRAGQVALARRRRGVVAHDVAEALGEASVVAPGDPGLVRIF